MAIPDLKQARLLKQHSKDVKGGGYITYTRVYDLGRLSLSDASLEPLDGLPEDSTIIISASRIGKVPGEADERAIVTARGGDYYQAVQTRTGTVTGVYGAPTTTVTATAAIFYPSIVGKSVVITATGTYVVASYTSPTVIVVTGDATCAAKAIAFDEGSRLLDWSLSDAHQWTRNGWWSCLRRYHCATADRDAEVRYLKSTTYTFAADDNSTAGRVSGIKSRPKDPLVPANALIEVVYDAPIYDK